jgi:hypothetical protein
VLSSFFRTCLIPEQGDPWFTLWMYDNKRHASTSIGTSRAGFDLRHIFGIALHDKVMSIVMKLMPPQSNRLPLAVSVVNWLWCSNSYSVAQINGLVWFLREQITTEMVYHVVFRQNAKPGHRICLADLDPVAFRQAAYPPVATLSLVVTSVSCFCSTCRFQTLISSVLRCLVRLL